MCRNPYRLGVDEYGCGQCMPCRINRRRVWTGRLMLEASQHEWSCFITLTYDNEHLPADGSLEPEEVQKWLKRLRRRIAPLRIRYYLVGEYGDLRGRPHYHVALFGFRPEDHIPPRKQKLLRTSCRCDVCMAWRRGGVDVANLTPASAGYIVSYVLKSLTKPKSCGERHPEFARMSNRPSGIGGSAIDEFAAVFTSEEGSKWLAGIGDVPTSVRASGDLWPLGRYLRRRLSRGSGLDERYIKEVLKARSAQEVAKYRADPLLRDQREKARKQHAWIALSRQRLIKSRRGGGPDETQ